MKTSAFTAETIYARCTPQGRCRVWQQSCSKSGYPRLTIKAAPSQYAHICTWILANGPVPEGSVLGNDCGNKRCCTPEHWIPRTRAEQNRIAASRGAWTGNDRKAKIARSARRLRGKLDDAKVLHIRDPFRKETNAELARQWNVTPGLIGKVAKGEGWRLLAPMTVATRKRGRYEVDPAAAPRIFSAVPIGTYMESSSALALAYSAR